MNQEITKERIFLFGNGGTLSIDKNLSNLLIWGAKQVRDHKVEDDKRREVNETNLLQHIENNFDFVLDNLQMLFQNSSCSKNNKKGTEIEEFKDIHTKFLNIIDELSFQDIERFFNTFEIEDLTKYIFDRAYDSSKAGYGSKAFKKNRLIGPMDGTVIDSLEKLQVFILSLFCLKYQNKPTLYDDFVRLLSKEGSEVKKVISLNWDNFYEQAFRRVKKDEEPLHVFIPNQIAIDVNRSVCINDKYQLLKPHGSLEYYCCQSLESSNIPGCFRVTVIPQEIMYKRTSYTGNKCLFYRKLRACTHHFNLFPFIQPYTRIERSLRSISFVRMAMEASKKFLSVPHELVVIGYGFRGGDKKGWIDYDLLPLFLGANKITVVSQNKKDGINIKKRMLKELPIVEKSKIVVGAYNGFKDYIDKSKQAGHLL